jgi:hypothetical protein
MKGRVIAQGTHKELMGSCDQYATFYTSQVQKEDASAPAPAPAPPAPAPGPGPGPAPTLVLPPSGFQEQQSLVGRMEMHMEMPSISRSISAPATSASGVGAEICNTDPVRAYNDLVSRLQVCPLVQIRTFTDSFLSLASLGTQPPGGFAGAGCARTWRLQAKAWP